MSTMQIVRRIVLAATAIAVLAVVACDARAQGINPPPKDDGIATMLAEGKETVKKLEAALGERVGPPQSAIKSASARCAMKAVVAAEGDDPGKVVAWAQAAQELEKLALLRQVRDLQQGASLVLPALVRGILTSDFGDRKNLTSTDRLVLEKIPTYADKVAGALNGSSSFQELGAMIAADMPAWVAADKASIAEQREHDAKK